MSIKEITRQGNALFSKKRVVDSLWQEIALNFYPERADFTDARHEGQEYADHLFTSVPVIARRELGNMFSASLRPQSHPWFGIHVEDEALDQGRDERAFLEFLTQIQRKAMYDRPAMFVKATKQADHDYAAFGNAVIHVGPNVNLDGLLYRNYHLRDCAWSENAEGSVDVLHRHWEPTARQLKQLFPGSIHREVEQMATLDPEKTVKCRHVAVPSRLYAHRGKNGKDFPYTSMFIDIEHEKELETIGLPYFPYVVPRWMTVSGSQYGRSMSTAVALPDGRTMQVVVRTLREAGEKYVDPPMIAVAEAIRGDVPTYAGGITIADMEYDERLGEVLRPISQNSGGMPIGFEIADSLKQDIASGFFLDKLQLPEVQVEMTAFEVRRRLEEQIRASSPIYEPIEKEYSEALSELTFDVMNHHGAFPLDLMPESLQGRDINFAFRSPLSDMADQAEAAVYQEGLQKVVIPTMEVDPSFIHNIKLDAAGRKALIATGYKAEWLASEEEVEEKRAQDQQRQEEAQGLEQAGQVAAVAEQGGKAAQALEGA